MRAAISIVLVALLAQVSVTSAVICADNEWCRDGSGPYNFGDQSCSGECCSFNQVDYQGGCFTCGDAYPGQVSLCYSTLRSFDATGALADCDSVFER